MPWRALAALTIAVPLTGCLTTANFRTIQLEVGLEFAQDDELARAQGVRWRDADGSETLVVDGLLADPERRVVFRTSGEVLASGSRPDLRITQMEEIEPGDLEPWPEPAEPVSFCPDAPIHYEISRIDRGPGSSGKFFSYPNPKSRHGTRLRGSDWPHRQGALVDMNLDWEEREPIEVAFRFVSLPFTAVADVVILPVLGVGALFVGLVVAVAY